MEDSRAAPPRSARGRTATRGTRCVARELRRARSGSVPHECGRGEASAVTGGVRSAPPRLYRSTRTRSGGGLGVVLRVERTGGTKGILTSAVEPDSGSRAVAEAVGPRACPTSRCSLAADLQGRLQGRTERRSGRITSAPGASHASWRRFFRAPPTRCRPRAEARCRRGVIDVGIWRQSKTSVARGPAGRVGALHAGPCTRSRPRDLDLNEGSTTRWRETFARTSRPTAIHSGFDVSRPVWRAPTPGLSAEPYNEDGTPLLDPERSTTIAARATKRSGCRAGLPPLDRGCAPAGPRAW